MLLLLSADHFAGAAVWQAVAARPAAHRFHGVRLVADRSYGTIWKMPLVLSVKVSRSTRPPVALVLLPVPRMPG